MLTVIDVYRNTYWRYNVLSLLEFIVAHDGVVTVCLPLWVFIMKISFIVTHGGKKVVHGDGTQTSLR